MSLLLFLSIFSVNLKIIKTDFEQENNLMSFYAYTNSYLNLLLLFEKNEINEFSINGYKYSYKYSYDYGDYIVFIEKED